MTLTKASRMPVLAAALCLLLMGFAGASYGAVRFDVVPSPTEVINTGLSEVTGSFNLVVRGAGSLTGTSTGGYAQIGIIYNSTGTFMPVDNTTTTGIVIFWTHAFATANPRILSVFNQTINGKCSGQLTINLEYGATPAEGDFIRIEGIRGRIAASSGATQGTDLYASLQSVNDPTANSFTPDSVRIAKSLPGMVIKVKSDNLLLCFPTLGKFNTTPGYYIQITEGFARAFVDWASATISNTTGGTGTFDRTDSGQQPGLYIPGGGPAVVGSLGAPTNSTQFTVYLDSIPSSVSSIGWSDSDAVTMTNGTAYLRLLSSTTDGAGNASALYSYETTNQTNASDITVETFKVKPMVYLNTGSTATGTVNAAVTLSPNGGSSSCQAPKTSSSDVQPRFSLVLMSDDVVVNEVPGGGEPSKPYAVIIRCNCYMLFPYVTSAAGFNTGIAVANTSQDSQVFGSAGAPQQTGNVTFYFYSASQGYRGYFATGDIPFGQSYVGAVSQMLGNTTMPDTTFSGYLIAKAQFQYCHAIEFIADSAFAQLAYGATALIIPDPTIKSTYRTASDAGDLTNCPAGEGLNN
jgi:hypothetical protein